MLVHNYPHLRRGATRNEQNLQNWDLDQLGNWNSTTSGTNSAETRAHDAANEITAINGSSDNTQSDAAGNMTVMPKADGSGYLGAIYDAWDRLTGLFDSTGTVAEYQYDGAGRRLQKIVGSDTYDTYYNENWQSLETRKNGIANPQEQTIWDIRYVDSPVVRFFDANTDGDYADAGDNTLYAMNDANFNVTGVVDASTGDVVERYAYTPYGDRTVLDGDFANATTTSAFTWNLGHQGLLHDTESGLVYNRNRMLDPRLGRFLQRDPLGYIDGKALYEYVRSSPDDSIDPLGLADALTDGFSPSPSFPARGFTTPLGRLIPLDDGQRLERATHPESPEPISDVGLSIGKKIFWRYIGRNIQGLYGNRRVLKLQRTDDTYVLQDEKGEMSNYLWREMMAAYMQIARESAPSAEQKAVVLDVDRYFTGWEIYQDNKFPGTGWWLHGCHRVRAQGRMTVQACGKDLTIVNKDIQWTWEDEIDSNPESDLAFERKWRSYEQWADASFFVEIGWSDKERRPLTFPRTARVPTTQATTSPATQRSGPTVGE